MANQNTPGAKRPRPAEISIEHYLRVILHRWWLALGTFIVVTGLTAAITWRLPDVFTSYTLILVDPQKVPETYVKPTITGDVRNRLGTLSQQILSATRLQKIIDSLNLYPEERKTMAREDVITKMRADINVSVVSDYGGSSADLQAFRITYSGKEPRVVAQVTSDLAALFIDENLRAREEQASDTTAFLQNQLQETRRALETQEAKLRDFKLKHIGEMPEQQAADLQVLGQFQSQLQIESEALSRAEQQKSYLQSMMAQSAPVMDLDEADTGSQTRAAGARPGAAPRNPIDGDKAKLAALLSRGYSEQHPDVRKLKAQIARAESSGAAAQPEAPPAAAAEESKPAKPAARPRPATPPTYNNPILQAQMKSVEEEIAKHKEEQQRLRKLVSTYNAKLEAIPVREQQIADLARDYEISKAHYKQLLEKQLSADTATQLEVRQKGEKFRVLDPAVPAERPSSPNRMLLNSAGAIVGLGLGLLLALMSEFLGMSITSPEQIVAGGVRVLEIIPVIRTHADRLALKRRLVVAAISGAAVILLAVSAVLVYRYRTQVF